MNRRRFEAVIEMQGVLRKVEVSEDVSEALRPGRRVPVEGTLNGYSFRTQVVSVSDARYRLFINEDMRRGAAVDAGDRVGIELERDAQPRTFGMPAELDRALGEREDLREAFDVLPAGILEELTAWIASAKKPETRDRYVARAVEMLQKRARGDQGRD